MTPKQWLQLRIAVTVLLMPPVVLGILDMAAFGWLGSTITDINYAGIGGRGLADVFLLFVWLFIIWGTYIIEPWMFNIMLGRQFNEERKKSTSQTQM